MIDLTPSSPTGDRFAGMLSGSAGTRSLHDTVLLETSEWVAAPSLGALMPGWLVVVPRRAALNYRMWAAGGDEPTRLLDEAARAMGLAADDYVWFEHGPAVERTLVGCGVDYAHLHMLIRPSFTASDLVATARVGSNLSWSEGGRGGVYNRPAADRSYFAVGQGDRAWVAEGVETAGSQYLRRAVAKLLQQPTSWNYRSHPQTENVARTIEMVEALRGQSSVV